MVANLAEAKSHNVAPEAFLKHYRTIRGAKDDHAATGTALARAKKAAKADGIHLDALKWLEKLADLETDEATVQMRRLSLYARWIELPVGTQLAMFEDTEQSMPSQEALDDQREWDAGDAGNAAGMAGHMRVDNPHPPGTLPYAAWDKAWIKGNKVWLAEQGKIAKRLQDNAKAAGDNGIHIAGSTGRGRGRGRPKAGNGASDHKPAA
jgi:hypothetical protein